MFYYERKRNFAFMKFSSAALYLHLAQWSLYLKIKFCLKIKLFFGGQVLIWKSTLKFDFSKNQILRPSWSNSGLDVPLGHSCTSRHTSKSKEALWTNLASLSEAYGGWARRPSDSIRPDCDGDAVRWHGVSRVPWRASAASERQPMTPVRSVGPPCWQPYEIRRYF